MLSKPFGQIDADDIQELCARGVPEDQLLEFKETLPGDRGRTDPWIDGTGDPTAYAMDRLFRELTGVGIVGFDRPHYHLRAPLGVIFMFAVFGGLFPVIPIAKRPHGFPPSRQALDNRRIDPDVLHRYETTVNVAANRHVVHPAKGMVRVEGGHVAG